MSIKITRRSHIADIEMVCAECKQDIEPWQFHKYIRPENGVPVVLHAEDCYDTYVSKQKGRTPSYIPCPISC